MSILPQGLRPVPRIPNICKYEIATTYINISTVIEFIGVKRFRMTLDIEKTANLIFWQKHKLLLRKVKKESSWNTPRVEIVCRNRPILRQ